VTDVLVDSSVWVAHFRRPNSALQTLLAADRVLCHPLVVLELACGTPPAPRQQTLGNLKKLRQALLSTTEEALELIEQNQLEDLGCGAVDMLLLASVHLTSNALLWTADKNLAALAGKMGVAFTARIAWT
jgi:predicted nucleic acid-binding protein